MSIKNRNNIDKLWDKSVADIIKMIESGELSNSEKIKLFDSLLRNYFPLLQHKEMIAESRQGSVFDKLNTFLQE